MKLKDKIQLIDRSLQADSRGWFLKVLTGKEEFLPNHIGEVYLTMANPGEWRANHYHPLTAEWFTVFSGQAKIILEDIETHERMEISLYANEPKTLYVPPRVAHVFINDALDKEMLLAVYAQNKYDPSDTIPYNLVPPNGI